MTPDEKFLAERIADPMLRSRDVIEAIAMAVAAPAPGAREALRAIVEDAKRPPVLRRIAAAGFFSLGGGPVAECGEFSALARGDAAAALAGLGGDGPDGEMSGWLAVAHTIHLKQGIPLIIAQIRCGSRHPDIRRQAAEVFRALTAGDPAAREALRREIPRDGSLLDDLAEIACG